MLRGKLLFEGCVLVCIRTHVQIHLWVRVGRRSTLCARVKNLFMFSWARDKALTTNGPLEAHPACPHSLAPKETVRQSLRVKAVV